MYDQIHIPCLQTYFFYIIYTNYFWNCTHMGTYTKYKCPWSVKWQPQIFFFCKPYFFLDMYNLWTIPHYLLSTGESYGPTAWNMQGHLIFFIQLNYVYKWIQNQLKCCHLMLNTPATRWHLGFYFLFLYSAILHSCIFGNSCLHLLKSSL